MVPDPQLPADLVTFTEEVCNRKLHFLCSATKAFPVQVFYLIEKVCALKL